MELSKTLLYALIAIAGTLVTAACVRLIWLAIGAYRINRAGPRPSMTREVEGGA